jgi:hypothetical protein
MTMTIRFAASQASSRQVHAQRNCPHEIPKNRGRSGERAAWVSAEHFCGGASAWASEGQTASVLTSRPFRRWIDQTPSSKVS